MSTGHPSGTSGSVAGVGAGAGALKLKKEKIMIFENFKKILKILNFAKFSEIFYLGAIGTGAEAGRMLLVESGLKFATVSAVSISSIPFVTLPSPEISHPHCAILDSISAFSYCKLLMTCFTSSRVKHAGKFKNFSLAWEFRLVEKGSQ